MRLLFDAVGSAMHWAERQAPWELAISVVVIAVVLYFLLTLVEGPAG